MCAQRITKKVPLRIVDYWNIIERQVRYSLVWKLHELKQQNVLNLQIEKPYYQSNIFTKDAFSKRSVIGDTQPYMR